MGFVQSVISFSGISSSVMFLPLRNARALLLEFTLFLAIALLSYAKIIHSPSSHSASSSASPASSASSPDSLLEPVLVASVLQSSLGGLLSVMLETVILEAGHEVFFYPGITASSITLSITAALKRYTQGHYNTPSPS